MNKEVIITPPEGYEIDREESTFDHIKFKLIENKNLTWEEIQRKNTDKHKNQYYVSAIGDITEYEMRPTVNLHTTSTQVPTERIAEKVKALCQLYIIAEWYNKEWVANHQNKDQTKYWPLWDNKLNKLDFIYGVFSSNVMPVFKSEEVLLLAYEANKEIFELALKP